MKSYCIYLATFIVLFGTQETKAQKRYVDDIFTDSDIEVARNIIYATNIDFLISNFTDSAKVFSNLNDIRQTIHNGDSFPHAYFDHMDTATALKIIDLKMDLYYPRNSVDTAQARPVIIYLHSGGFLPPGINGSPVGERTDSAAQDLCWQWAKRGYVAVSASYRLGWNPLAVSLAVRRSQYLNAVYRAVHDTKKCVEAIRMEADGENMYRVDSTRIALYGEGSGGYVALAYGSLDKYEELALNRFTNPQTGKSFIDTAIVGNIDGSGGLFNLYETPTTRLDVMATVAAGGALMDTSWLEAGDAPMIALHCIRDPFVPFDRQNITVTTGEVVYVVDGAKQYISRAMSLGNNNSFKDMPNDDLYTVNARSKYGKTYGYIYAPPRDTITLSNNLEGLYPIDIAPGRSFYQNQSQPWQWWDSTHWYHKQGLISNPDMSAEKGRRYIDTIIGYVCPRLSIVMGYYTTDDFVSVQKTADKDTRIYPNPARDIIHIELESDGIIQRIVVLDLFGKNVQESSNVNAVSASMNLSDLSNGYYWIQVITDTGLIVHKIQMTN